MLCLKLVHLGTNLLCRTSLETMVESGNFSDILSVRTYLDAQRGG